MAIPGRLARGTAGALGDGGAAGALGNQPGQPRAAIVSRAAGKAAVDHDPDIVEGQAGFGNGAGQNQLARARLGRGQRGALLRRLDPAVKPVEDDVGRQVAKRLGGALDLRDARQEGEQRAVMFVQRAADRAAICGSIRCAGSRPSWTKVSG